jgi:hypothetical protein
MLFYKNPAVAVVPKHAAKGFASTGQPVFSFYDMIGITKKKLQKKVMMCAALEIEGLLGRPPGLCDGDLVSEGLDIIVYRIVTHPPSVNNIG